MVRTCWIRHHELPLRKQLVKFRRGDNNCYRKPAWSSLHTTSTSSLPASASQLTVTQRLAVHEAHAPAAYRDKFTLATRSGLDRLVIARILVFIDLHEHEHCSDPADHLARVRQHLGNAIADQALSRRPDASYGLMMQTLWFTTLCLTFASGLRQSSTGNCTATKSLSVHCKPPLTCRL